MQMFQLANLPATQKLGNVIGQLAQPGHIILLEGELGSGKTTLTQAIGHGLHVDKTNYITSPTFSIIHEYSGRIPLYHMDFYRIADRQEFEELGIDEYLYGSGLSVVEWPERLADLTPGNHLKLCLKITGDTSRALTISAKGSGWGEYLQAILKLFN
jgi:tRNA threonylcarbamoyladenosine biosynthesis protein TsaE